MLMVWRTTSSRQRTWQRAEAAATVASVQLETAAVRALDVVFSQPMAIEPLVADGSIRAAFSLVNLQNGPVDLATSSFVYSSALQTLTWTSAAVLSPGVYELRLDGALLSDTGGNLLHGGTGGLAFSLPVYTAAQDIQVGTAAIDVDNYSVPSIADWNADGVRDLIVGEKTASGAGKVRVYLNTGTAAAPAFDTFFYAQQEGQDLSVAWQRLPGRVSARVRLGSRRQERSGHWFGGRPSAGLPERQHGCRPSFRHSESCASGPAGCESGS